MSHSQFFLPRVRMRDHKPSTTQFVLGLALSLALGLACSAPSESEREASANPFPEPEFLAGEDSSRWVEIYDPKRAWNGYTLALYGRRIPMLLDMNGRVVHSWPEARVKSRIRLLPDGRLLGLALGRALVEYDWDGNLIWEVPIERAIPHHDVIRLTNGNTMVLILREGSRTDDVLEIDRAGDVVWEWRSDEHLAGLYDPRTASAEITHLNSVQELPPNRWFDGGDPRFRPGNLLISARNLNAVYLVDRETKKVVWRYEHELDRQHEALMVEKSFPRAGNILLFDNGYASWHRYRQSRILEIDPSDNSIVWAYEAEGFYSPTGGIEQPLPNGNILISSTRGGRAFEIDRAGRTVWEWVPPFEPNRPTRVAYDHCPQLESISTSATPSQRTVRPEPGYRHIDPRTYVYARDPAIAKVRIDGTQRHALKEKNSCRKVLLPAQADLLLGFGINRRGARSAGHARYDIRFRATIAPGELPPTEPAEKPVETVLLDHVLDINQSNWQEQTIALDGFAFRWVDLCLSIEPVGGEPVAAGDEAARFAFWTNPAIVRREPPVDVRAAEEPAALTREEIEVQREHLKALGYID